MFAGLIARSLTMVLSLLTVPLTLNYLGAERYGIWLTISSLIGLLAFTDLGVGSGLLNALSRELALRNAVGAKTQIASAAMILCLVAITFGVAFALLYPLIPWATVFQAKSSIAISEVGPAVGAWLACFLVSLPLSVGVQTRLARQEGYLVHITAAAGNLAAVFALLLVLHAQLPLPALVLAMAGPPVIASAVNCWVLFSPDASSLRSNLGAADLRIGTQLLRTGSLFVLLQFAMAMAFTSDTLVLTHVLGPQAVAEYGVASRLFLIPAGIIGTVLSPLWPAYGDAIARGDVAWARRTLTRSIIGICTIAVPIAVLLIIGGQRLIRIWVGDSVSPPPALLACFGLWTIFSAVGSAVAMLLNGAGEIRIQAIAAIAMALANLALSIWLTFQIGVAGVMVGTLVAYLTLVLGPMSIYVPIVLRRLTERGQRSLASVSM
ncbi:MAG: oligosaccharide flippase family protein [Chloroflexi bacterium]|nr:oligosaccharide flippase family protein [Chloroflexota bacterium]